jgi:hypothetical protein
MNKSREALISKLVEDTGPGRRRLRVSRLAAVWLVLGALTAVSLMYVVGPFRPGFMEQLLTVPRFSLEMLLGAASIAVIVMIALRMSVPGAATAGHITLVVAVPLLWLSSIALSIFFPALALGNLGMRHLCWLETLAEGFPIMVLGFWIVSRGYVLHWVPTGFLIGLVSGFIPGLLMQIACMYDAKHALVNHIGPAFLLALLGGATGFCLIRWRSPARSVNKQHR